MKSRECRLFLTLAVALFAAQSASAKKFTAITEPVTEGRVFLNGQFIGVAPVEVNLKLKKNQVAVLTAEKGSAIGDWPRRVGSKHKGAIVIRLEEDESYLATEESDVANTWITVTPNHTRNALGDIDEDKTWQKLVSVVTDNFSDLEQVDRASYYVRSAWRVREYAYRVLRHRLVVKRGVTDELTLRVSIESQIAPRVNGLYRDEDFVPTRRIYGRDRETVTFLRDQL